MASRSENTTRCAQGLLERQAVLAETPAGLGDRTDTVGVLLRVSPLPGILVVTNEADAREEICAILASGEMPTLAPEGPAAVLQTLRAEQPGIIITDDHEMTRALRALSPESYIVVLTGNSDSEFVTAIEAGADDCIPRHGTPAVVLARIKIARRTAHVEVTLRRVLHENRKLSTTDPLTKVANRHFFARHFPLEVRRAARYGHSLSVGMCDIDHFKVVNDTYGHGAGDAVLREFGARIQKCVRRGTDWIARIGGEEFAIVLPEIDYPAAIEVATKIRDHVRATPFLIGKKKIAVTASFGVAGLWAVKGSLADVPTRLQSAADAALYRSKREGRDRVTGVETATTAPAAPKARPGR